jgi:site-specific recombinase XerD
MTREVEPADAVEQYLKSRHDIQEKTRDEHRYRLKHFVTWCDQVGLDSLDELEAYDLERYKNYRMNETECSIVTLRNHMHTLRQLLRWAEKVEAVEGELSENVIVPTTTKQDEARDVLISHEYAREIIDYLSSYHYCSTQHLVFHILYHTGLRRSGILALDVEDWNPDERILSVRNREEQGTRIKGGDQANRNISITDSSLVRTLNDWVGEKRPDVTDDHGRKPLLATRHGRMHYKTVTQIVYKVSRPCYIDQGCPHDRDIDTCEATKSSGYSKCPSSVSAHPIRRSAITHHLAEDVPKDIVSKRMSVSKDVLEQHYDGRDLETKRRNRLPHLEDKDI